MTLLLLAELLTEERLDELIKEYLTDIVWTRATPLGGGLKAVVAKLGESSGVAADEVAWRGLPPHAAGTRIQSQEQGGGDRMGDGASFQG